MDESHRLALSGEDEIKKGNTVAGIRFLDKALQTGTKDPSLLSAIYCQLGNGYYAVREFEKAVQYHARDCFMSQVLNDPVLEIKALCNLSHALTMSGRFDEAVAEAETVLNAAPSMKNSEVYECRGYYALGFAHFQKFLSHSSKGRSECLTQVLNDAAKSYEVCLEKSMDKNGIVRPGCAVVRNLTLGNLGITNYYLGQYEKAKLYYEQRLESAKSVGDRAAQLRTYTNLGNTCVQLGEHETAVMFYQRALAIAKRDRRKDLAAQLHFNLGSTEALQRNYKEALSNHLAHLELARTLQDLAGQARGYLSLALCLERLSELPKALFFLASYWKVTESLNSTALLDKARSTVEQMVLRHPEELPDKQGQVLAEDCVDLLCAEYAMDDSGTSKGSLFRLSNLSASLESFIVDCSKKRRSLTPNRSRVYEVSESAEDPDCGLARRSEPAPSGSRTMRNDDSPEDFLDMLSRMQGKRFDDQRCDSVVLKDRTNDTRRQGDSLSRNDTTKLDKKSVSKRLSIAVGKFKESKPVRVINSMSRPSLTFKKSSGSSTNRLSDVHSLYSTPSVQRFDSHSSRNSAVEVESVLSHEIRSLSSQGHDVSVDPSVMIADEQPEPLMLDPHTAHEPMFKVPDGPPRLRKSPQDILDLIMNIQGRRMDEQRADPLLPGLSNLKELSDHNDGMSERLYDMIMERQSHRLDDQRSELGGARPRSCSDLPELPDDMSELVISMSSRRIESQRAYLKPLRASDSDLRNPDQPPARCASASAAVNLEVNR